MRQNKDGRDLHRAHVDATIMDYLREDQRELRDALMELRDEHTNLPQTSERVAKLKRTLASIISGVQQSGKNIPPALKDKLKKHRVKLSEYDQALLRWQDEYRGILEEITYAQSELDPVLSPSRHIPARSDADATVPPAQGR